MRTKCVVPTHAFSLRLWARYEHFELFRILHIFWIIWIYGIIICHSFSTLTLLNTKPAKLEEEEQIFAVLRRKIGRNFYYENEPKKSRPFKFISNTIFTRSHHHCHFTVAVGEVFHQGCADYRRLFKLTAFEQAFFRQIISKRLISSSIKHLVCYE